MLTEQQRDQLVETSWLQWIDHYEETESTNDRALEVARHDDSRPRPGMVLADLQTAGRGQGARQWWSPSGCLMFSILMESEQLVADGAPLNSLLVALAWEQVLRPKLDTDALLLKWPNDLWLQRKKLAGILIESVASPTRQTIVGCGLNVNVAFQDAPLEIGNKAVSLAEVLGHDISAFDLVKEFLTSWHELIEQTTADRGELVRSWEQHSGMVGEPIRMLIGERQVRGICSGVDQNGQLLVDLPNGDRHAVASGTVLASGDWVFDQR